MSPIGVHGLASSHGVSLLTAELFLVWLPFLTLGVIGFLARRLRASLAPSAA